MNQPSPGFWEIPVDQLLQEVNSSVQGLTVAEATERLKRQEAGQLRRHRRSGLSILFAQFTSPIILLLICSAVLSLLLRDQTNAVIILLILGASSLLGWWQEWSAADAVSKLLAVIVVSVGP